MADISVVASQNLIKSIKDAILYLDEKISQIKLERERSPETQSSITVKSEPIPVLPPRLQLFCAKIYNENMCKAYASKPLYPPTDLSVKDSNTVEENFNKTVQNCISKHYQNQDLIFSVVTFNEIESRKMRQNVLLQYDESFVKFHEKLKVSSFKRQKAINMVEKEFPYCKKRKSYNLKNSDENSSDEDDVRISPFDSYILDIPYFPTRTQFNSTFDSSSLNIVHDVAVAMDIYKRSHLWTNSEQKLFAESLNKHGKDFLAISAEIGSKTPSECVEFFQRNFDNVNAKIDRRKLRKKRSYHRRLSTIKNSRQDSQEHPSSNLDHNSEYVPNPVVVSSDHSDSISQSTEYSDRGVQQIHPQNPSSIPTIMRANSPSSGHVINSVSPMLQHPGRPIYNHLHHMIPTSAFSNMINSPIRTTGFRFGLMKSGSVHPDFSQVNYPAVPTEYIPGRNTPNHPYRIRVASSLTLQNPCSVPVPLLAGHHLHSRNFIPSFPTEMDSYSVKALPSSPFRPPHSNVPPHASIRLVASHSPSSLPSTSLSKNMGPLCAANYSIHPFSSFQRSEPVNGSPQDHARKISENQAKSSYQDMLDTARSMSSEKR